MRRFRLHLTLLTAVLLAACAADVSDEPTSTVMEPPPEILAGTIETGDAQIVYDAKGAGETALVFVHCWACDRDFWRHQMEAFAADYRVVALDLPGHGATVSTRTDWSIAGLAEDVRAVVEELDLDRVILVGHSMGGPVSVFAAPLMPERVIGVTCLDTLHNAEQRWDAEAAAPMIEAFRADFEGMNEQFIPMMFREGGDPELIAWVTARANASDHAAAQALMEDFPNLDLAQAFTEVGVPIRCVNAAAFGELIPETMTESNQQYADFDAVLIDGVGHYLQLERPDEVNRHLTEIFAELDGR